MNRKKITLLAALLCLAGASQAQYLEDAMRFSQPEYGGSARFRAMGNASTSLGGDLSSITGNPAGLGFFNNSDAGISLNYFNDIESGWGCFSYARQIPQHRVAEFQHWYRVYPYQRL